MPKSNFFTLNQSKRDRILKAALDEFSSEAYTDASINQIVKASGIARGSFYLYFDDKEDLYFYLVSEIVQTTATAFMAKALKKSSTDVFEIYRELLLYSVEMISNPRFGAFFKHLILGSNSSFQQKYKDILRRVTQDILQTQLEDKIKSARYETTMLQALVNLLGLINRDLLEQKIIHNLDDAEILRRYEARMLLIRQPSIK